MYRRFPTFGLLLALTAAIAAADSSVRVEAAEPPLSPALQFGARFESALGRIGEISPDEFADRFGPAGDYLPQLTWDPTTARYWDQFAEPKKPSFRLNEAELKKFRANGFAVSERLGGRSFGEIYLRV